MRSYLKGGLKKDKYRIKKIVNRNSPYYTRYEDVHPDAEYFVLRIDADPHARKALLAYADSVIKDNSELSNDLINWHIDTEEKFLENQKKQ